MPFLIALYGLKEKVSYHNSSSSESLDIRKKFVSAVSQGYSSGYLLPGIAFIGSYYSF